MKKIIILGIILGIILFIPIQVSAGLCSLTPSYWVINYNNGYNLKIEGGGIYDNFLFFGSKLPLNFLKPKNYKTIGIHDLNFSKNSSKICVYENIGNIKNLGLDNLIFIDKLKLLFNIFLTIFIIIGIIYFFIRNFRLK